MRTVTQTSTDPITWDYHTGPDPMEGQRLFKAEFEGHFLEGTAFVYAESLEKAHELVRIEVGKSNLGWNTALSISEVQPQPNTIIYFNDGDY